jgi:hypothetical protein
VPLERVLAGDDVERAAYLRVANRAAELKVQLIKAEAAHIGVAVAQAFS